MKNVNQPTYKIKQNPRKRNPGERPGNFEIKENAITSKIDLYSYNIEHLQEFSDIKIEEAISIIDKNKGRFHWLDIKGLGSQDLLNFLQKKFDVNPLAMEDIVNTYQRPKSEVYDHCLFVISRMLELDKSLTMKNEQISFLLFDKLIITFQEDYKDVLDPVRNRLRSNQAGNNLRILGPSYLLYALLDTIIESFKETSTSLMDVYLSLMSNRMNEVMKFLTIISSIFIPLTFIAGIYGMNFAYQDPKTGSILPLNMPELYMSHGYVYIWVVMVIIAIIQLGYFIKKGWFRN
jgi:Mg2+ and Co2+ transporter CorA